MDFPKQLYVGMEDRLVSPMPNQVVLTAQTDLTEMALNQSEKTFRYGVYRLVEEKVGTVKVESK
jgi:hypothetical protein